MYKDGMSLPKYERPEGPYASHKMVDLPEYPNVSAAIERELVALRQQNADLQASNNSLRERAQRAEDRVRVLEARESDGA